MSGKIRIAFIKYAGMTMGGSELWLQKIAAGLPKNQFAIDYFYCDDTNSPSYPEYIEYLEKNGVQVIKFSVTKRNLLSPTHRWINTNFWEKFDAKKYDIVQTVKAGPREYPFYKIQLPVVEIVALANRPDRSKNIAWSFHSSSWQRNKWIQKGGLADRSSVLPFPSIIPSANKNYREELNIPIDAIVAGFHQRADNNIFSPIPLNSFHALQKKYPDMAEKWHFIIKNGASKYREQAEILQLKNIHFLEATTDLSSISRFLNTLDFFAHGRKDGETFGAVFIEAMMHGKPCLSHFSQNGANAQIETMGPAGLFAYTPEEYTQYLYQLYSNIDLRLKLSKQAIEHVQKKHSMDACINIIANQYVLIANKSNTVQHDRPSLIRYIFYTIKERLGIV